MESAITHQPAARNLRPYASPTGRTADPAQPSGFPVNRSSAAAMLRTIDDADSGLMASEEEPYLSPRGPARDVFVVHGRDEQLRQRFFGFLRALDLRPLEWETIVEVTGETAPSLLSVVRAALAHAQAIVVLLSPEDIVQLHPSLREPQEADGELVPTMQARPNVLIELGMALASCPDRTIVIEVGRLRPVADLGGLNVIHFDGGKAALDKIVRRLRVAGCQVDDAGSDWHTESRFADVAAYDRHPAEPGRTGRSRSWRWPSR